MYLEHLPPNARAIRTLLFLVIGVCMVVASAGCEGSTGATSEVRVQRDTIGGVVYVHHTGSTGISGVEELATVGILGAAGGEPSPEEFGRVESVIADTSGNMYVADGLALEIRVFTPGGQFLRQMGRKGQGPGEMEGMHGITWLTGDTMVVMDFGNARLSLLTSGGEVVGQWPWMRLTGSARFLFNGGPREFYAHTFRPRLPGDDRPRSAWVRYTSDGPQDTLDIPRFDPRPGTSAICRGDGIGFMDNPFGDQLLSRPAPEEERVLAWSSEYRLAFVDALGDTVRVITRDVLPTILADSAWVPIATQYSDFRSSWKGADCEGEISRPEFRPILEDIVFDNAGRLLVEYMTASGSAFDLFGVDAALLATFPSPPNRDQSVAPFLSGDRLYLVTKDSLDVQRVRAYRISTLGL